MNRLTQGIGFLLIVALLWACQQSDQQQQTGAKKSSSDTNQVIDNLSEQKIRHQHADSPAFIRVPASFKVQVVARDIGYGRHLVVRENGDIYMALRNLEKGKGIVALRDTNQDYKADIIKRFGEHAGTGLGIYKDHLYFGRPTAVERYPFREGRLVPAVPPQPVVQGFPEQNQHATKSFAINQEGELYVNVGAPSNACMEKTRQKGSPGQDPCPQLKRQAGVWKFSADQLHQKHGQDGTRFATGIRNAVAIDWNAQTGELYLVQHGRDQLYQFFPDTYTEAESRALPSEEFFLVQKGDDFGWPYCYHDWRKEKKVLAPEYGGDGTKVGRCKDKEEPIMAFPGHWAPNDLLFYESSSHFSEHYRKGAFITFHGSWNRRGKQEGYFVAFVPFKGKQPVKKWEVFADGFAGKQVIRSPGEARYRPMGLAVGPKGALYISDSKEGTIWRVSYQPDASSTAE